MKVLHLDANHELLISQLSDLGFTNHTDYTMISTMSFDHKTHTNHTHRVYKNSKKTYVNQESQSVQRWNAGIRGNSNTNSSRSCIAAVAV